MQNKRMTKFLSIILCIVLILAVFSPFVNATITEDENTGSIFVSGIEAGVKVSAYQLITVNYDYDNDQPDATPYKWVEGIDGWVEENFPEYSDLEYFSENVDSFSNTAQDFYSKLIVAIRTEEITISEDYIKEETAEGEAIYPVPDEPTGSVTFEDCDMGTYLILIENGYRVYTPSVVNLLPTYDETEGWVLNDVEEVTIKSSLPSLEKTIGEDGKVDNFSTADDIPFTIRADIPTYLEDSIAKEYQISDKICDELTIDFESITVYGQDAAGDLTELVEGTDYDLIIEDATRLDGTSVDFLVDFDYDQISSYDKVVIKFNARLIESDTILGADGNINDAYLQYSNNPYDDTSFQTLEDEVIVYTYGIEVIKIDGSSEERLSGAQFNLADEDGNLLYFVQTGDGEYYQAQSTDDGATQTLVVGSSGDNLGVLLLYGLDEGTYTLIETVAPDGYNKSNITPTITIKDSEPDGILDDAAEGDTSGIYSMTFANNPEYELPLTGGYGTIIFAVCGALFVIIGITIIVITNKKNKKEQ